MDETPRFSLRLKRQAEIHLRAPSLDLSTLELSQLRLEWARELRALPDAPFGSEISIRVESRDVDSWCLTEIYEVATRRNLELRIVGSRGDAVAAWADAIEALEPS